MRDVDFNITSLDATFRAPADWEARKARAMRQAHVERAAAIRALFGGLWDGLRALVGGRRVRALTVETGAAPRAADNDTVAARSTGTGR